MGNHRLLRFINRHGSFRAEIFDTKMHPYVKAWADIFLHGFLLLPWYIFEWIISGFDSKVICLPVKRYWSMNGKNVNGDGKGLAVPFGILEGVAFVATAFAYFYFNRATCMDRPIAYSDASKLLQQMDGATGAFLNKAVVRAYTDYPSYLGSYIDERAKSRYGKLSSEASEFTLLDEDLLKALVANCGDGLKTYGNPAVKYDEEGIVNMVENTNFTSANVCNLITFTEKCVCAGVYSAQALVDCVGTSDKIMKSDGGTGFVEDTIVREKLRFSKTSYIFEKSSSNSFFTVFPVCFLFSRIFPHFLGSLRETRRFEQIHRHQIYVRTHANQFSIRYSPHRSDVCIVDELFSICGATHVSRRTQETRCHVGERLASWFVMSSFKHGRFGHVH